ncbi:hypothetical protein T492DRAFT_956803 [Pavlovales sp. CCMP2436]|nr:hypothetical protein T492DRAFT_956803 [Pavlovales sp. CCMP2436]
MPGGVGTALPLTPLIRSDCAPEIALVHLLQVQGLSRVFRGFTGEELEVLTSCFAIVGYDRKEVLFERGKPFTWAGVLISGVVKQDDDAKYRTGDFLGEASVFTTSICEIELVGHEPGLVACITLVQIAELSVIRPALALKVVKVFAEAACLHAMGFGHTHLVDEDAPTTDDSAATAAADPTVHPAAGAALLLADRNVPLLREWGRAMVHTMGWFEQDVRELKDLMTVCQFGKHVQIERVGMPRGKFGLVLRGALSVEGPQGYLTVGPGGYFGVAWGLAPEGANVRVLTEEVIVARAPLAALEAFLAKRPVLMGALIGDVVRHFYKAASTARSGADTERAMAIVVANLSPPVVRAAEAASTRLRSRAPAVPDPSRYESSGDSISAANVLPGTNAGFRSSRAAANEVRASSTLTSPLDIILMAAPEAWGIFLSRRMLQHREGAGRAASAARAAGGAPSASLGGSASPSRMPSPMSRGRRGRFSLEDGPDALLYSGSTGQLPGASALSPVGGWRGGGGGGDGGSARQLMAWYAKTEARLAEATLNTERLDLEICSVNNRAGSLSQQLERLRGGNHGGDDDDREARARRGAARLARPLARRCARGGERRGAAAAFVGRGIRGGGRAAHGARGEADAAGTCRGGRRLRASAATERKGRPRSRFFFFSFSTSLLFPLFLLLLLLLFLFFFFSSSASASSSSSSSASSSSLLPLSFSSSF